MGKIIDIASNYAVKHVEARWQGRNMLQPESWSNGEIYMNIL